jgi:hypothetical protein
MNAAIDRDRIHIGTPRGAFEMAHLDRDSDFISAIDRNILVIARQRIALALPAVADFPHGLIGTAQVFLEAAIGFGVVGRFEQPIDFGRLRCGFRGCAAKPKIMAAGTAPLKMSAFQAKTAHSYSERYRY